MSEGQGSTRFEAIDRELAGRIPPSAIDVEMAVLGAMMRDSEAAGIVIAALEATDFYKPAHRKIFAAGSEIFERGEMIDLHTLANELERNGDLEKIGGRAPLVDIADSIFTSANASAHARIVKEKAVLRALIELGHGVSEKSAKASGDVPTLIQDTSERLLSLASFSSRQVETSASVASRLVGRFDDYANHKAENILQTNFTDLNHLVGGIKLAEYTVFAGRPGTGKSAFVHSLCLHLAGALKVPVGIFTLEMGPEEVLERMCCMLATVDSLELHKGTLSVDELSRMKVAAKKIGEWPILFDESPDLDPIKIRSRARSMCRVHGCKAVVLDHLQLVSGPRRSENRQQEMTVISRACAISARETGAAMIVLSQLNRATESRSGGRPTLADLRESGAIEQDAHNVFFLYHGYRYDKNIAQGQVELIAAKQRNGPTGIINLAWRPQYTRFENYSHDAEPGF